MDEPEPAAQLLNLSSTDGYSNGKDKHDYFHGTPPQTSTCPPTGYECGKHFCRHAGQSPPLNCKPECSVINVSRSYHSPDMSGTRLHQAQRLMTPGARATACRSSLRMLSAPRSGCSTACAS